MRTGDASALARPVRVAAGTVATVAPAPPTSGSDVLVVLSRPLTRTRDELRLILTTEGGSRAPDVFLHARTSIYAVWYGANGHSAVVSADGDSLTMPAATIQLRPKQAVTYRGALKQKPGVDVSINAPAGAFKSLEIAVARAADRRLIAQSSGSVTNPVRFNALPPEPLRVTLTADRWEFIQDIDLTAGEDGDVVFTLEPIVVTGTVKRAREPTRARITFEYELRTVVEVEAGDDGRYSAVFWKPALYSAEVYVPGASQLSFSDPAVDIERNRTLDFEVPGNQLRLKVVDRATSQGIANAVVTVDTETEHGEVGAMRLGRQYTADDNGRLVLPPLWAGRARFAVTAPGYRAAEPQSIAVDAGTRHELVFALERAATRETRLLLPNGQPAAGAEAIVVSLNRVVWSGSADSNGRMAVGAQGGDGLLVIRHPGAASRVLRLAAITDTVHLGVPAPAPIRVKTVNGTGAPVPFALLTLWLDGQRLPETATAFASWSRAAMTDHEGMWAATNLPAAPLRVLATRRATAAQIGIGAFDALAATIDPGPAGPVEIRAVE